MKQQKKLLLPSDWNEKDKQKNLNSETNNKTKTNNTRNKIFNIKDFIGKINIEISNNNTNTHKNSKYKEKLMKIISLKSKKTQIKDKNGKILNLDRKQINSNKENFSFICNVNSKKQKKDIIKENIITKSNIPYISQYIKENENQINENDTKLKAIIFHGNSPTANLTDNKNFEKLNEDLLQNEENNFNVNGKKYRGTISFNNFIKNNYNEYDNKKEDNQINVHHEFKKRKGSYVIKRRLSLDNKENLVFIEKGRIQNKNNSPFYNYRNGKEKNNTEEKICSHSTDKNSESIKKRSLKFLDILKKILTNRILLKEKKEKISDHSNIDEISKNKKNDLIVSKINKEKETKEMIKKKKDIYDEIMDEVKQEKNYVQKIIHMKLVQGIKLLKQNSHRQFNIKSDSKTYENTNFKREKSIQTIPKYINEKTKININGNSTSLSKNNLENKNIITINNSCKNIDEEHGVKIKKIKLDKLKNKLKKESFNFCQRNSNKNININLSLNNKIININNKRIYEPKKVSFKRNNIYKLSSIPIYHKNYKNDNCNSFFLSPNLYQKQTEENKAKISRLSLNSISPFNDSSFSDLNKLDINNKLTINTNLESNESYLGNNRPKIKSILYNKALIEQNSNEINNGDNNRLKTLRYIRNKKNKLKRNEDNQEGKNDVNRNKIKQIIKTQEIQFRILKDKNKSRRSINNVDKTKPINFNLNEPIKRFSKKNNSYIRTFLSHDMDDLTDIMNFDISKKNISNISQFNSSYGEEISINSSICKLSYNYLKCESDKISNNNTDISSDNVKFNYLKKGLKREQSIYNLLDFEDLLIIEDKLNLIFIVLEKGNKSFDEYYDFIIFFFSSNIKNILEQIFKYLNKETETMHNFIYFSLIFIIICYDFAQSSNNIDSDKNYNLIEIFQLIYTNILLVINSIKNQIEYENNDNYKIRLIELSKISYIIKDKLPQIDNDKNLIKEILFNNTKSIEQKIINIINNLKESDIRYEDDIFKNIKKDSFIKIYNYFLENILKEDYIGCSILAYSYLKHKSNFVPLNEPYLIEKNEKKYTLVLDLDETLIHFRLSQNKEGEGILKLRPGVFTFLEQIKEFYEIILFTEASEAYVKLMLEAFNNHKKNKKYFDFILYRQYTVIEGNHFVKNLNRLGRPLNRTIIIDNIQKNFCRQKCNGILIKPFLGEDKNDKTLIDLIQILINIAKDEIDVRNGLMKYRDEILTKVTSNLFRRGKIIKLD